MSINLAEYLINKKIILICGHYGAGKTNVAVNLAVRIKKAVNRAYTLVDLDTVNPYFRSADNTNTLKENGIDFIIPPFANTNVDIPAVPPEIYSVFAGDKRAMFDVGGDDTGATVLGMFSSEISRCGYEMIYVINKYRNMIGDAEDAKAMAEFIENKSKLKITSAINNSNVGAMTTREYIYNSFEYADKTAEIIGVPLIGTSVKEEIAAGMPENIREANKIFEIKDYTKKYF